MDIACAAWRSARASESRSRQNSHCVISSRTARSCQCPCGHSSRREHDIIDQARGSHIRCYRSQGWPRDAIDWFERVRIDDFKIIQPDFRLASDDGASNLEQARRNLLPRAKLAFNALQRTKQYLRADPR